MPEGFTNYVLNGSFEDDFANWPVVPGESSGIIETNSGYVIHGNKALRGSGVRNYHEQEVTIPGGASTYEVSAWFTNTESGDPDNPSLDVEWLDSGGSQISITQLNKPNENGSYKKLLRETGSIPVGAVTLRLTIDLDRNAGVYSIHHASIESIVAQFDTGASVTWSDPYEQFTEARLRWLTSELVNEAANPKTWLLTGNAAVEAVGPFAGAQSVRLLTTGDAIYSADLSSMVGENAQWTLYFWVKLDALAGPQGIFCLGDPFTDSDNRYQVTLDGTDLRFIADEGTTIFDESVTASSVLTAGQWHLMSIMRSRRTSVLWVDGSPVIAAYHAVQDEQLTNVVYMGGARVSGNYTGMTGNIGDVWLVNGLAVDSVYYSNPATYFPLASVTITQQPQDTAVEAGVLATLTVVATGTGELSYQWYNADGTVVSGATNASFQQTGSLDTPQTSYYVKVTDANGTVQSQLATISVKRVSEDAIPRTALCWNFEDDNFAWFDAAHDTVQSSTNYSLTSYRDTILGRGFDGLWILSDTTSVANDESDNNYHGVYRSDNTYPNDVYHQQGSFLDDPYRATLFGTVGFMEVNQAGPGGTGMISEFAFAAGAILTIDGDSDRMFGHYWDDTGPSAGNCCLFFVEDNRLAVYIYSNEGTERHFAELTGQTFNSGDVFFFDFHTMDAAGVFAYDIYHNLNETPIFSQSGDMGGTFDLAPDAYIEFGYTASRTMQYCCYKSGGLEASDIAALKTGYDANFIGYQTSLGTPILDEVVCMKYQFDPGWEVRWSDLEAAGTTWAQLQAEGTLWSDFYSGGAEENMYWLTAGAVLLSDQLLKKNGLKQYTLTREQIDLSDTVPQWTTGRFIYANEFYFHMETESSEASVVSARIGWSDSMMDVPDYTLATQLVIQDRASGGDVKWDFRTTGRYLAMDFNFNAADEIRFVGGELRAEQSHGR